VLLIGTAIKRKISFKLCVAIELDSDAAGGERMFKALVLNRKGSI